MNNRSVVIVAVICCLPTSAFAYIDPGSGMLLWQGLIAGIGALLVFFRSPREAIKRLLARFRKK